MINPNEFIRGEKKQDFPEDAIDVSGTFICQECDEKCSDAKLDEDKGALVYYCTNGHKSQARL